MFAGLFNCETLLLLEFRETKLFSIIVLFGNKILTFDNVKCVQFILPYSLVFFAMTKLLNVSLPFSTIKGFDEFIIKVSFKIFEFVEVKYKLLFIRLLFMNVLFWDDDK